MNFSEARAEVMQLLNKVDPRDRHKVLNWIRTSDQLDELLSDNRKVILQNISEHLRVLLPPEAMLPSETTAYSKEDILSIWNRTSNDQTTTSRIRDTLRRVLNLPTNTIMEYKTHNDSLRDNSSFRNTKISL